ncbi:MlaC/ttg2D family ABC transporter substrate-binding protein [Aquabacterium sp.]|uniref:MlaC/ttg2D family ABC transporter substrate-binding protein n=1 Tax=Aquabacterium sp. TaxID=1872578 RepID=UPI003BAF2B34
MTDQQALHAARSPLIAGLVAAVAACALMVAPAQAQQTAAPAAATTKAAMPADVFIKNLSAEVLGAVRGDKTLQAGDVHKVVTLVDSKILPNVNFQRMTASAVGRNWRQATAEQKTRLQDEFKNLLIYTYAGAVSQIRDQAVDVKPMRSRPEDADVVVRTQVKGSGDPIQLDYRLEKSGDGWKIYDVNVMGAWLVQTYQSSFSQEVSASGIDGLIAKLAERNKQLAARKK